MPCQSDDIKIYTIIHILVTVPVAGKDKQLKKVCTKSLKLYFQT